MDNCIFCEIVKRKIPSTNVYENDDFVAFLDIQPVADGHVMIIPKKHIIWMQEADDETLTEIFKLTKKLMLAMKKGLKCDYVQVSVVGKDVPHFHVHLIPRYMGDGLPQFQTKKYQEGAAPEVAKKIAQAMA